MPSLLASIGSDAINTNVFNKLTVLPAVRYPPSPGDFGRAIALFAYRLAIKVGPPCGGSLSVLSLTCESDFRSHRALSCSSANDSDIERLPTIAWRKNVSSESLRYENCGYGAAGFSIVKGSSSAR
jgi:hypothetical protein